MVVDKPEGWTSHDVVSKVRRIARTKKVGHLGTLDPIATGVLPLVIGRATRLAQFYTRSDKVYEGVVRFGWSTDSYDRAGAPTSDRTEPCIDASALEAVEIRPAGGYFRLLARRLLNGLQFFTGGIRWLGFVPAAILLVPPAMILPWLDGLDREKNFTVGYLCWAKKGEG